MKRKRNWHPEKTRQKIKLTQLINRMQDFVLGKVEPACKNGFERWWGKNEGQDKDNAELAYEAGADLPRVEMTPAQVNAASNLIKKALPDLTASDVHVFEEEARSPEQQREELVNNYGETKTRILMDEELGWTELMELEEICSITREWLEKTRPKVVEVVND